ncbi:hypothetical protein QQS21_010057 [Conoideocrella luteorostrata]|uniref:Ankyrin repeat protein n=1 Tax=Conoideocrella luteorostrata TaxID=1105319 RepID=A0AAJ0FPS1_9HYPO|nr:hypothetical protein QQS21_010057 [Conoideocrella luteorostrata]
MADPFSLCHGVITIFGAAKDVCNSLIVLKHAPREIEELRSALGDPNAVLDRVVVFIQTVRLPDSPNELLQLALDEATRVAEPLHSCLGELASSDETSPFRRGFDRVVWSRKRGVIKDYVVRLVNVKVGRIFALQAEQIISSSRIGTKLASVAETCAVINSLKSRLDPAADAHPGDGLQTALVEAAPNSQHPNPLSFDFRNIGFLQRYFGLDQNINEATTSERCQCGCHLDNNWVSPTYLVSMFVRDPSQQSRRLQVSDQGSRLAGPADNGINVRTALDLVIANMLTCTVEHDSLIGLTELFKIPDGIESQRFSRVHEAVLGLRAESLTQAPDQDIAHLDEPDANRITPISWAAAMGNHEAISTLMDHLADVDAKTENVKTPLVLAIMKCHDLAARSLIKHGAHTTFKGMDGCITKSTGSQHASIFRT